MVVGPKGFGVLGGGAHLADSGSAEGIIRVALGRLWFAVGRCSADESSTRDRVSLLAGLVGLQTMAELPHTGPPRARGAHIFPQRAPLDSPQPLCIRPARSDQIQLRLGILAGK